MALSRFLREYSVRADFPEARRLEMFELLPLLFHNYLRNYSNSSMQVGLRGLNLLRYTASFQPLNVLPSSSQNIVVGLPPVLTTPMHVELPLSFAGILRNVNVAPSKSVNQPTCFVTQIVLVGLVSR